MVASSWTFEFDARKSAPNFAKHGIDFEAAQALWDDDSRIVGKVVSEGEERWMVVGSIGGKLWSAIMTWRGNTIRLISVRRVRPKEAAAYDGQKDQDG